MRFDLVPPLRNRARAEIGRRAAAREDASVGELSRCAADPAYFADTYAIIDDTQGDSPGAEIPFKLWPAQRELFGTVHRESRVVILKARQLGISWLVLIYALWLCIFQRGRLVLFFSKGQTEANELLRRAKAVYARLPDWIKAHAPHRPNLDKDTATEFGLANGSTIRSLPATKGAGRTFTASLVVMDEAAWMAYGGHLFVAAKPTIDAPGGRIVVLSTANGVGGFFHKLYTKAVAGLNRFCPVFLSWRDRPDRDEAWYARIAAEAHDPDLVAQEYPGSAAEAFVSSGRSRFKAAWVEAQRANLRDPVDPATWPEDLRELDDGSLRLYGDAETIKARGCFLSADVAEGKEDGDASVAYILDSDGTEWGELHGRWEPDEFARRLWLLSRVLDLPVLVERNNHGHAVLVGLKHRGNAEVLNGHDGRPGWLTNETTRAPAIAELAARLRDGRITVRTEAVLDELSTFQVGATGKAEAAEGYHDDRVLAWANGLLYLHLYGAPARFQIL